MALRTNYRNDELNTAVNPNKVYEMTNVADPTDVKTVTLEDVSVYTQNGDMHTAEVVNQQNIAINKNTDDITELNKNLNGIQDGLSNNFGEDVTVPLNTDYVCLSAGMVLASGYNNNACRCEVNGRTVMVVGETGTFGVAVSWRVNKNDVVRFTHAYGSDTNKIGHTFRPCV